MRNTLLAGALLAVTSHAAESQAEEAILIEAYRALNHAMLAADTAAIRALTTEDFSLTHITGYRQSRSEWLAHIGSGKMRYFRIEEDSVQAQIRGAYATLTGRSRTTANIWGAQGTWPLQLDIQFVRENGQWRMQKAIAGTY